jgi:hypothetical protein
MRQRHYDGHAEMDGMNADLVCHRLNDRHEDKYGGQCIHECAQDHEQQEAQHNDYTPD